MDIETFYKKYFTPGNVSTDSRNIGEVNIFVALRGEKFNGNEYAGSALSAGARVAVIDDPRYSSIENTLLVEDCLSFLQKLAIFHRRQLKAHFIGLTGTNGKTTTKELLFSVLSEKYICRTTQGNLNNHIGVPLTILSIPPETEIAIIEMGANHLGEIESLCNICQPDSGLVTNIGKAHLEGFGNLEGVKKAKGELFQYLIKQNRKIYINGADDLLMQMIGHYQNLVQYNIPAGICAGRILDSENTLALEIAAQNKKITIRTNLSGDYNKTNVLAAAAAGLDFDLSLERIKKGLEKFHPSNQRSQLLEIGTTKLLLDCYNANPTSMKEAIESFVKIRSEKKIAILGEMKELGEHAPAEHENIGNLLAVSPIDQIFLIGKEFDRVKLHNAVHLSDAGELRNYIPDMNTQHTAILVKGSRANKLERIRSFFTSG
jgi:UDP-N-acetylmuramoyl-tripeptide--D-alanyl-D-alanine ligase